MLILFWILTGLLAFVFLAFGSMKLVRSREALASSGMGWAADFSAGSVRLIGVAQILGAIGLVLPALLGIAVVLSPIAAIALTVLMIGAIVTHAKRSEPVIAALIVTVLLLVVAFLGFTSI